jgi:signal transduction histidine kinase
VGKKSQLIQLYQNLIGNAIKVRRFDPPRIHVASQRIDQGWQISVRDNGIGIDQRFLVKIFEVFQRLHGEHVYPGTGMGLAICKAIVERHGGRIWVESEKGAGSVFHFILADPASELAMPEAPP